MNDPLYPDLAPGRASTLMPLLNRFVTRRSMAAGQGVYYVASGLWPLLHMDSFEAITGPKRDRWLVKTVGALVAVSGGLLTAGAARGRVSADLVGLAAGEAAALTGIDVVYAAKGRISKVYLLDALAEVLLLAGWGHALAHQRPRRDPSLADWEATQDEQRPPAPAPRPSLPARLAARVLHDTGIRRAEPPPKASMVMRALRGAGIDRAATPAQAILATRVGRALPDRLKPSPAGLGQRMLKPVRRRLPA